MSLLSKCTTHGGHGLALPGDGYFFIFFGVQLIFIVFYTNRRYDDVCNPYQEKYLLHTRTLFALLKPSSGNLNTSGGASVVQTFIGLVFVMGTP